jgi:hypothetical protein
VVAPAPIAPPPVVTPSPVAPAPPPPPVEPPLISNPTPCTLALDQITLTRSGPTATLAFRVKPGYTEVLISLVVYVDITTTPTGRSGPPALSVTTSFSAEGSQQMTIAIPTGNTPFQLVEGRCGDRMNMNGAFIAKTFDNRFP